jgi:hypothetical protein
MENGLPQFKIGPLSYMIELAIMIKNDKNAHACTSSGPWFEVHIMAQEKCWLADKVIGIGESSEGSNFKTSAVVYD